MASENFRTLGTTPSSPNSNRHSNSSGDNREPNSSGSLTFGVHVKCRFCKGQGSNWIKRRGIRVTCPYCNGRGVLSRLEERQYLPVANVNTRVRTTLADGTSLREEFDWAHEADIRAKAVELFHDKLATMKVGQHIDWAYHGYLLRTTIMEHRDPPPIG